MEFFEVGGCVRDEIMGVPSKDIDFTVVIQPGEIVSGTDPFEFIHKRLSTEGFKIFQHRPEFLTIRAMFPDSHKHSGVADFVLARKDGTSTDGRRPDFVEPGTLEDDLARRDFTMNAIAKDADGNLIDPFGGQADIEDRMIRAVGNAEDRLREDVLRGLRALRFSVTKGFRIDGDILWAMNQKWFADALSSVSKERQREELEKMFAHDTLKALRVINDCHIFVREAIFSNGLRLSATMKA